MGNDKTEPEEQMVLFGSSIKQKDIILAGRRVKLESDTFVNRKIFK